MHKRDLDLLDFAKKQYGYFTASQASALGFPTSNQFQRVKTNAWQRLSTGLFRLPGFEDTLESQFMRWLLWSRNQKGEIQGVVSHASVLQFHRIMEADLQSIHLIVPKRFRKKQLPGCIVHKDTLLPSEIAQHENLRLTTLEHAMLSMKSELEQQGILQSMVKRAIRKQLISRERAIELELLPEISLFDHVRKIAWETSPFATNWSSNAAFSLVELIICVALVSIMLVAAMPVIRHVRRAAMTAACASNLQQMWTGVQMYTNDSRGFLPPGHYTARALNCFSGWPTLIAPYMYARVTDTWQVYWCPAGGPRQAKSETRARPESWINVEEKGRWWSYQALTANNYGVNKWLCGNYYSRGFYRKLSQVRNPGCFLLAEADRNKYPWRPWTLGDNGQTIGYWHNRAANFLFLDSSVKCIPRKQVRTFTDNPKLFNPDLSE